MSLVAYGASDDSETSDIEESETSQPTESGNTNDHANVDDGKISDEDDYVPTARIQSVASSSSSTNEIGLNSVHTPSTLNDLPAPKAVTAVHGGEEAEDELEEEVKPKASQLADAPKPPPKKVKQPTRIVLPALKKQDSDDEEESIQKKPKNTPTAASATGSRSGLFALLPAPTHSSKKQANRPLIPYTLTKRPAASKITPPATTTKRSSTTPTTTTTSDTDPLPSQKHQSAFNALTGYESDSDEEEGGATSNFFSFGNEAEGTPGSSGLSVMKNSAPALEHDEESRVRTPGSDAGGKDDSTTVQSVSSHPPLVSKPVTTVLESPVSSSSGVSGSASTDSSSVTAAKTQDSSTRNDCGDDDEDDDDDDDDENENKVTSTVVGVPQVNQDAPLNFSSSMQSGRWSSSSLVSPMVPELYAAQMNSSASSYWQRQQHYAQDYNAAEDQVASSSSGSDFQQYMEDEQFLRMSGKRKRNQEDIQIIDANVDDYVDPSELMKGISEESAYQPHRKKENMPSMQQKRKKQITYLAFQAKERELELKNAWSQNRMTKNQARSKYGF